MTAQPQYTEAVILIRQGNRTMAVHVPNLCLYLTAIVNEPDILPNGPMYVLPNTTITGYEVEATGVADRLTIWEGADPFERDAIAQPQGALDA